MRGIRTVRSLLTAAVLVVIAAGGASAAETTPRFDIQIERDTRPRTSILTNLSAAYRVTLHDRATGQAPEGSYTMFSQAKNAQGERTPFFACGHVNDVDSRTPPGVYDCIVYVDHGGTWTFIASVSKERSDTKQAPVALAQASADFDLPIGEVAKGEVPDSKLHAKITDVVLLLGHATVAVSWFGCVGLLLALALAGPRRWLSEAGRHRLERRLDEIIRATMLTTGLILASGLYLTLKQTAYKTPFSSRAVHAVFALPWGKPYFLTLAVKISLYLLMAAATIPLVRGARARMLSSLDAPRPGVTVAAGPWGPRAGDGRRGAVAVADPEVATETADSPAIERGTPATVRLAAVTVAAGGAGVWLCVTILKYL
ncbi:MAG TPA: hypothetical protein VHL53_18205, partial [Acidimicrobiia bacterium]|nr:hypothetical protein [Acidimicrobiia bacterium]